MTTLDKHADIPVELALQLEGAAILEEKSTAEFLEDLLDRYAKRGKWDRVSLREREELRDEIRNRNAQGWNDVKIAKHTGKSQQSIQWHRSKMEIPPVKPPGRPKKSARL